MDFGTIIGIIGIIIGIACSIFFYLKGKKKKKVIYNLETTILISENLSTYENLRILYNDENIKSLSSTIIKIKNVGNDIIEPDNFVPAMPIVVETSDRFLLKDVSKYKVNCSNSQNRVNLAKIDETHLKVNFDYLNPKDEICITILHSGNISVSGELKQGDVKNYSNKKYEKEENSSVTDYNSYESKAFRPLSSSLTFLVGLLSAMSCVLSLMCVLEFINNNEFESNNLFIIIIPLIVIQCFISIVLSISKK